MLPDGTYDVFIVDASHSGTTTTLDLTILAGPHKGEVVTVTADHLERDELDLLGTPATLVVAEGVPHVLVD